LVGFTAPFKALSFGLRLRKLTEIGSEAPRLRNLTAAKIGIFKAPQRSPEDNYKKMMSI
jgi:hypothetical protein